MDPQAPRQFRTGPLTHSEQPEVLVPENVSLVEQHSTINRLPPLGNLSFAFRSNGWEGTTYLWASRIGSS